MAESAIMTRRHGVSKGRSRCARVPSERGVMSDCRRLALFSLMVMEP